MAQQDIVRERVATLSWREPGALFATRREESGLEYLRGLMSGEVTPPPVAQVLGITMVNADPGRVRFDMPVHGFVVNHLGFLAGGILSTVIDSALGCAVLSAAAADQDIVTADLSVDFLRPVKTVDGSVTVDAELVHLGRSRAVATCRALDADQRLCAIGRSTCLIRPKPLPTTADSPGEASFGLGGTR
ncbi:PaaI family thioesterase [Kitasatospora sp. NPDC018058]|uniref:PaaI family thioesterase n=1 Tax=Kitasatospora sp. NPDC018058 TaxID=3364025 RepID=UPI0037C0316A